MSHLSVIDGLLTFSVPSLPMQPEWLGYIERWGSDRVRGAVLPLLGWMQQCGFRSEVKAMSLRGDMQWCQDLESWTTEKPLAELFRVERTHAYQTRERLVFQAAISLEEQLEIVRHVFRNLGPPRVL